MLYVGFMCHQAIEKAIKGIFVARKPEDELPYIHKLMRLANLAKLSTEMSEEQLSLLDILSPLNIEAATLCTRQNCWNLLLWTAAKG